MQGTLECFTGYHIPLAICAIFVLLMCVLVIPLMGLVAVDKLTKVYCSCSYECIDWFTSNGVFTRDYLWIIWQSVLSDHIKRTCLGGVWWNWEENFSFCYF